MWAAAITIFPEMFNALTREGVVSRAIAKGCLSFSTINPRDYTEDRHATVDDRPYGGGPGMVMMVEPLTKAVKAARAASPEPPTTIFMSPQGRQFNQQMAIALSKLESLVVIAGRYEGVDERFVEREVDLEVSLGDFVLTGGELAAMVLLDAVARLVPGAVGNPDSVSNESHFDGLLDCAHYTRPARLDNGEVPPVLLSGDHAAIGRWRRRQSLGRTWERRPDLLAKRLLDAEDRILLQEFLAE